MKLKLSHLTLFVLILCSSQGFSQGYDQLKVQLQFESYYGSVLRSSLERRTSIGPIFLYDDWFPVEVELPNGTVSFEQGKINIQNSTLEVVYKDEEKVITADNIKNVTVTDLRKKFIPATKYKYNDMVLHGFMELYGTEAPMIMTHHYIYVKKPNTDGYVNAGLVEDKLIKASTNYLFDGAKLVLIKNRKDVEKAYPNQKHDVKTLAKNANTDFKNARSLQNLVNELKRLK